MAKHCDHPKILTEFGEAHGHRYIKGTCKKCKKTHLQVQIASVASALEGLYSKFGRQ